VQAIIQWAQQMTELGQFYPETSMLVDAEMMGRELAKALNVPATIIRSQDEVAELIDNKEQAELEQRQIEMAMGAGQAAQAMGQGQQAMQEAEQ